MDSKTAHKPWSGCESSPYFNGLPNNIDVELSRFIQIASDVQGNAIAQDGIPLNPRLHGNLCIPWRRVNLNGILNMLSF